MSSLFRSAALGCLGACALVGAAISPAAADAIPYQTPGTVAPTPTFTAQATGDLIAYFFGSTASYDETLGAFDVTTNTALGAGVFPNKTTAKGASYNFGTVNAGDVLRFFINVLSTGDTFSSQPSENADGINHAYATEYTGGTSGIPAGTFVGFEDQFNGGDLNYNDETFVFTNTVSSVPLPASAPMFGAALLALGAVGFGIKRKKAAAAV